MSSRAFASRTLGSIAAAGAACSPAASEVTATRADWHAATLGSPRWFFSLTTPWVAFFGWSAAALLLWGTIWGLAYAPADYQQGNSFRIMYVHVPAAMLAQSLYIGMGVAGFIGVVWRMKLTDVAISA